jgi:hypothetical protein
MSLITARISGVLRSSDITLNSECNVTLPLDIGHLSALLGSLAVFVHLMSGEINHEAR